MPWLLAAGAAHWTAMNISADMALLTVLAFVCYLRPGVAGRAVLEQLTAAVEEVCQWPAGPRALVGAEPAPTGVGAAVKDRHVGRDAGGHGPCRSTVAERLSRSTLAARGLVTRTCPPDGGLERTRRRAPRQSRKPVQLDTSTPDIR